VRVRRSGVRPRRPAEEALPAFLALLNLERLKASLPEGASVVN